MFNIMLEAFYTRRTSGIKFYNQLHTHSFQLRQNFKLPGGKQDVTSSLWFTTLPARVRNAYRLDEMKKVKLRETVVPKGDLIISCKNKKLNHYKGIHYKKFNSVPLASRGWAHRKSKGDYFQILPTRLSCPFFIPDEELKKDGFLRLGVSDVISDQLKEEGVTYPTIIQSRAIPQILAGKSVVVTSETGSGKTLAYVIPMLEHILRFKSRKKVENNSPLGVVLVPTRELAVQIGNVISSLVEKLGISCKVVLCNQTKKFLLNLGPENYETVDIIVTTLGVICKYTYHKFYSLSNCIHVVIDEADTLMDDSFSEKLRVFLKRCKFRLQDIKDDEVEFPAGCHVTFVSATVARNLEEVLEDIFPMELMRVSSTEQVHRIQPHVLQTFVRCLKSEKPNLLLKLVMREINNQRAVIIFSNNTATCNWVTLFLKENNIACSRLNGSFGDEERLEELENFKNGRVHVMSCTDLASRGCDIRRIRHVINYDFPIYMADYVHRCGRTGRMGCEETCEITNIISSPKEVKLLQEIEKAVRTSGELPKVNNNITRIIRNRIEYYKDIRQEVSS